jgi:hypothetical protein
MARLNSGTRIYGNATIDTFATISGNLNTVGGNVNIASGGTVTAINGTAGGSYTTIPTITISSPTTLGGVQATGTVGMAQLTTAIAGGGTGYTVNDVLTFVGGTGTAMTVTVTTVSAGVITGFTVTNAGTYTVLPTNPISVTGGTGSGATFNVTAWQVRTTAFTITNAGSGYVAQPTVSFSSGSASAYAVVGGIPKVQALGNSLSVYTPTGEQMRVADRSGVTATSTRYVQVSGGVNGVTAPAIGTGGGAEALDIYASGGFGIYLATNGIRTATQAVISHTPSAVNYINLTGSTANNGVTISAQGTGTNLDVIVTPKGTGNLASTGNVSATGNVIGGNILTAGIMSSTGNALHGNLTVTGNAVITYAPATAAGYGLQVNAANTQGGTGYGDFLKVTNTSGGATNPNKSFRLNSTGFLEIINSAYTGTLFSLSDSGNLSVSGQLQVSGNQAVNGPAFRAYVSIAQTITSGTQQKVTFGTENFDTNSNFASSTFTPTVAGYYQLTATVRLDGSSSTGECMIVLYKNGAEYARGTNESGTEQGANFWSMQVSDIASANGSTDYFEVYVQQTSGASRTTTAGSAISHFSGCMLRGA